MDASEITSHVVEVVRHNGLEDRIEVIKAKGETLNLPEQVDLIVSEWMGTLLLVRGRRGGGGGGGSGGEGRREEGGSGGEGGRKGEGEGEEKEGGGRGERNSAHSAFPSLAEWLEGAMRERGGKGGGR